MRLGGWGYYQDDDGMAFKIPNSPYYWYKVKGVRYCTETSDRAEARAIEGQHRAQLHAQKFWDAPLPLLLGECLRMYLQDHADKRSAREDRIRAVNLLTGIGDASVYELTPATLQDYTRARLESGRRTSTVNRELALLSVSLNYARARGFSAVPNPVRSVKLREPEPRTRWLTQDEAARLLAACRQSRAVFLADWVLVALHTGCRAGELYSLQWGDVTGDRLTVRAERAKSGRSRTVPLTPEAAAAIARQPRRALWVWTHPDGSQVQDVREALAFACRRAGIEPVITPHVLRHTCASWLAQAGVAPFLIRDWLGHSTLAMTERYAHLSPDHLTPCATALATILLTA